MDEICGDGRLSFGKRIQYLLRNAVSNLLARGPRPNTERFYSLPQATTAGIASPSRALTEAFLISRLPELLPIGTIRVLEIGCGSGRLCRILAELGYSGEYVGIDIDDRNENSEIPEFQTSFWLGDAHNFTPNGQVFDLIISISVLEHVPRDAKLIDKSSLWLSPGGLELHFLPSGWGLLAYLWHGWRQYPLRRVGQRFGDQAVAYPLGGLASFLLHVCFITIGEMLLHIQVRKNFPRLYGYLLRKSLVLDRYLPNVPTMYVVRRQYTRE